MMAASVLRRASALVRPAILAFVLGGAAAEPTRAIQTDSANVHEAIRQHEAALRIDPADGAAWRALGDAYVRAYPGTGYALWAWIRGARVAPRDGELRSRIADGGGRSLRSRVLPVVPLSSREGLLFATLGLGLVALSIGIRLVHARGESKVPLDSITELPPSAARRSGFRRAQAVAPQESARAREPAFLRRDGSDLARRILSWTGVLSLTVGVVAAAELRASRNVALALPARAALLRSPVRGTPVLGVIRAGAVVRVIERRDGWMRAATLDGQEGWVEARVVGRLDDQLPLFPEAGFLAVDVPVAGTPASALESTSGIPSRAPDAGMRR